LDWLNENYFTDRKSDLCELIDFRIKDKKDDQSLVISYSNKKIEVKIFPKSNISYLDGKSRVKSYELLSASDNKNELRIYIKKINSNRLHYILPILDVRAKQKNDFINSHYDSIREFPLKLFSTFDIDDVEQEMINDIDVMEIMDNYLYYKYRLSFMGILLYILMEFYQSKQNIENEMRKRVIQVISNPKIVNTAPFLRHWSDFYTVGFPIFVILFKIVTDFKNYIINNVSYTSKRCLMLQINEICLSEVNRFFGYDLLSPFTFFSKNNFENYKKLEISDKIKDYKKTIVKINENLLKKELEEIELYKDQHDLE
jgi:hypothetical protein